MKYTAIIVDDETKVCQLIQALGHWEKFSIEVIDVCMNGEDAFESIYRNKPDIILADIRMPGYDGLELIQMTRKQGIESVFIIISGYQYFEYVHSAMSQGVKHYLLKPISEEQLNRTLEIVCDMLMHKQNNQKKLLLAEEIIEENNHVLRRQLAALIIENCIITGLKQLAEINLKYQTNFSKGYFQALVINTNNMNLHEKDSAFFREVDWIVLKSFEKNGEVLTYESPEGIYCLLNYKKEETGEVKEKIKSLYFELKSLRGIFGNFNLSIGVGVIEEEFLNFHQSIKSAVLAEQAKLFLGWNKVLFAEEIEIKINTAAVFSDYQQRKHIETCFEVLNIDEVLNWFALLKNRVVDEPPALSEIFELRAFIIERLQELIKKFGEYSGEVGIQESQIINQTSRAANCIELIEMLKEISIDTMEELLKLRNYSDTKPIRLAKKYIAENYQNPVTLEDVAAHVNFSPTYFSSIFKKYIGMGFHEYLTEIRVEQAKELLRVSELNISEIAAMVGYPEDKYFRKLFKKVTGIRPSDYRRLYT